MKTTDAISIILLLAGLLGISPSQAQAPDWVVKAGRLTLEEGLSSRFISQIYQDAEGFMWFVTSEGLNRYDGYRLEAINPRLMGARTEEPVTLLEDCDHHIWLVSRYRDISNGAIRNSGFQVEVLDPVALTLITGRIGLPAPSDSISAIAHIPGQLILIGTVDGQVFAYDGGFYRVYQDARRRPVKALSGHETGRIAVVIGSEVTAIGSKGEALGTIVLPGLENWKLCMDREGRLWVFAWERGSVLQYRLNVIDMAAGEANEVTLPDALHMHKPGEFDLAFRREGGWVLRLPGFLGLYDRSGKLEADLSGSLGGEETGLSPTNLYIDRKGAIWGVQPSGVVWLSYRRNIFRHYLSSPPFSIRGMTWVNDSTLFVSNYTHQLLLNVRSGAWSTVGQSSLVNLGATRDRDGNIWAGRHYDGFLRYSPDLGEILTVSSSSQPSRIPRPAIGGNLPFQDSKGRIWFGLTKGVGYWDNEAGQMEFLRVEAPFSALMDYSVNAFLEAEDGIWLGTSGGLFRMNHSGEVTDAVAALSGHYIFHIHRDRQGRFWLATRGSGLICWDSVGGGIRKFDRETGFISDVVYAVIEDRNGRFWLPTNKGLMRFKPETASFSYFTEEDGLASEEFNYLASTVGPDGRIYLGGLAGISAFHPDSVRIPEWLDSPVRITSFSEWAPKSGKMTDKTRALMESGQITLVPPIQSFHLTFSPLDFHTNREDRYAYWLEDLGPGWTFLDKPDVRLSRLPPGRYILHLNGRGENGLWLKEGLRVPVFVKKPFYLRPLFWTFLLLGLGGAGFLYYRWSLWRIETQRAWLEAEVERRTGDLLKSQRIIREQNLKLERLNQTKDQLFLILAHELKNPVLAFRSVSQKLSYLLRRGQYDRLSQLGADLDRTASGAHQLLDNLLQWAKTQQGAFFLHPRIIYLREAFDRAAEEYRDRLSEKDIRLETTLESEDIYVWADPAAVQILLRNLLDNAVKFTPPGGQVSLLAGKSGEGVSIAVQDNGAGMTPEKLALLFQRGRKSSVGTAGERGSGLGLLLVKELMDLHHGSVSAESQEGQGTVFTLWFPPRGNENSDIQENNLIENE